MGMAKESALNAASNFGDLATSMGINTGTAADMSMSLTQLGADMASFKNISVDRAQTALQAVFTGETEALKAMGIVMTEANLEQHALNTNVGKTYKEMNQTEKVMLRYSYVMAKTSNAQGDFARNSDSVANRTRSMGERLKEAGASFGQVLAPMVAQALGAINNFLNGILAMDEGQRKTIVTIALVAAAIPPLISAIGGLITAVRTIESALSSASLATGGWVAAIAGLAAVAAGLLVTSLMKANERYREMNKEAIELKEANDELKDSIDGVSERFEDGSESISSTEEVAKGLVARLEELEKQGLSTGEAQREYADIVEQLNTLIPDLNLNISETTGRIEEETTAVYDRIDAYTRSSLVTLLLEEQREAITNVAKAQRNLNKAQTAAEKNYRTLSLPVRRFLVIQNELAESVGMTVNEFRSLNSAELGKAFANATPEVKALLREYFDLVPTTLE